MQGSDPRPRSARGRPNTHALGTQSPSRKVLNCIVDDTALIQGAKKSTRDGIRKWVAAEQIRIFVPLYSMSPLDDRCDASG